MKKSIYILLILLVITQSVKGQDVPIPENYSIVDMVKGDLDKDGIKELVVSYNTDNRDVGNEVGVDRALVIYKLKDNKWVEWRKSEEALLESSAGGMMGDPFGYSEIKKGILLISQNGGSSWKWGFTDKYRFQNGDFYLIGYTGVSGKPCEYWQRVDFNLSTGKIIVKKEYESCEGGEQKIYKRENETFFKKGLKITLQNRSEEGMKITTAKYGNEVYLSW